MKSPKRPLVYAAILLVVSVGSALAQAPAPSPSPSPSMPMHGGGIFTPILYSVTFKPMNSSTNGGSVSGNGTVLVDGGHFGVSFSVSGVFPDAQHMAHIHKGPHCPTGNEDPNGDGVLDVVEAGAIDGGILVPLDGDLSTFDAGSDHAASPDAAGNLYYIGSGSYSSMVQDLHRTPAPDPKTGAVALAPGENLDLDKAVIVIHGIDPGHSLPATAQTVTGLTANQSLSIACGELTKVEG